MEQNISKKQNIIGLSEDQTIYRYVKFEHIIDLLKNKRNTLVKPKLWNDPFENLICKIPYLTEKRNRVHIAGHDRYFGQCWTSKEESNAMWHICSPCRTAIKIKTTVEKIFDPINDYFEGIKEGKEPQPILDLIFDSPENFQVIIGKVDYLPESEIIQKLQEEFGDRAFDTSGLGILTSFLFKRIPFDYEEEVRIMLFHQQKPCDDFDTISYNIEPNKIIEEMIIDPRADDEFVKLAKSLIRDLGFENSISKSTLYDVPNLVFDFHNRD